MICPIEYVLPNMVERLCIELTRAHWPYTSDVPVKQKMLELIRNLVWAGDLFERYLEHSSTQLFLASPAGQIVRASPILVSRTNSVIPLRFTDADHRNRFRTRYKRFLHLDPQTMTVDLNRNRENDGVYDDEQSRSFNPEQMRAFERFQGWSLCLKEDLAPTKTKDLQHLTNWPDAATPSKKGRGRPNKVDRIAQCLSDHYPSVVRAKMTKKALRLKVIERIGFDLSMDTLNRAMKNEDSEKPETVDVRLTTQITPQKGGQ